MGDVVKSYLVIYERLTGARSVQKFDDATCAMAARMSAELTAGADTEVVVLSSDSEASLRETHSRYFLEVAQILRASSKEIKAAPEPAA